MKKGLSLILVFALLLSLAIPAAAAEVATLSLSADKTIAAPGETITVSLDLDSDVTNVMNFGFEVYWNADLLELTGWEFGESTDFTDISAIDTNDTGTYVLVFGMDTINALQFTMKTGNIIDLVFTVKEGACGTADFKLLPEAGIVDYDTFVQEQETKLVGIENAVQVGYSVTVSESENGTVTADKTLAAANDTITLTPAAAEGYELDEITVTDASGAAVTVTDNAFAMPASNVTVAATFKATVVTPATYAVNIAEGIENGSVTTDVTAAEEGATVTVTATPVEGYELDTISVTDASGNAVTVTDNTFTMPASNVTVSATFKQTVAVDPLTITAAGEKRTVTEVSDGMYFVQIPEDSDITVADVYGSIITCWSGSWYDDNGVFDFASNADGSATITATELKTGILGADEINMYITSAGITLPVASADNSLVNLTTDASDGTGINMARNIFIELIPAPVTYYTVTVNASDNGTVVPSALTAAEGDTVTLTATPVEGYELDKITVTDAEEKTVTVTDNKFTMPASNVTVTATFKEIPVVTAGYSVTASTDVSITAGENAEVSITVTEADSKAYNAYELNITYPEGLTYVSASGSGVEGDTFQANHDSTNRIIQIIGYGADKASGTAAAKLTFTGSTTGEYDVTITSAKVDAAASAPTQDTPDATIVDSTTKITITGYIVSLGEGLSADSNVANPGEAYTFSATDYSNYNYKVTAKIGDTEITVTDNGDGTYTIPADQITGNITVTAVMTAKKYDVTYDGTTTEDAATYKVDYVFTPEKDGFTVGGVTIQIGDNTNYTGYSNVDGTYTIPGADITGDIVISIDWVEKTPESVTVNKGNGVLGGDTATKGEDYTFFFGETDKYDYDEESLKVTVGEGEDMTDITAQVTYNEETGEYTIPGTAITGPITISIERTEKVTFTVEVSEYLTLNEGNKMYLVTVKGVEEGKVAMYDGKTMYWSAQTVTTGTDGEEITGYGAYAWLVISNEGLEAVKTAASEKVTTAEGTSELTVDYSGDVNGTEKVDVNDAQLVYNMYNAYYGDFETVTMQKFLNADVNSDMTVTVNDAAAIVDVIVNQ